jgi:predicted dehydrogenase
MTDVVRWGILSTANIATEKVIPAMRQAARTEIVAIASRDAAVARSVADRLGIPTAHGSYEALLADPSVDAVYIPLPNHLHLDWTIAAVAAGKHVLCEKPLALTAADAQRMVDAADATGVHLMEAFMYRLHPSWVAVSELVASGRIGRLAAIQSWFSYYNDDPSNIRNVLDFGGGALYDIGCYCVNMSRLLFGGEPTRVSSAIRRDPTDGTDIMTSAILEFEAGVATFTCSTRTETDQRVHIYGDAGRISIGIPFNIPPDRPTTISVTAGGDPPVAPATEVITFPTKDPYAAEVEAFSSAILDGGPTPVPPADAVANLRVIESIFAAAAEGGS